MSHSISTVGSLGTCSCSVGSLKDKEPAIKEALPTLPAQMINLISSYANEILSGLYGPDAWKQSRNIDVLDDVPRAPGGDLNNRILLYIPRSIRVNGKQKELTLNVLMKIYGELLEIFNDKIFQQFNSTLPGWVFLDKKAVAVERMGMDDASLEKMIEAKGCSVQTVCDAILLNLMVFEFTGEKLYKGCSLSCAEKVDGLFPIILYFTSKGLAVTYDTRITYGIPACALRKFN